MDEQEPLKRVTIDQQALWDLETAIESSSWEMTWYFDSQEGTTLLLTDDDRWALDALDEDADADIPDWQRESVEQLRSLEQDETGRYLEVPTGDSREGWRDMSRFIGTVRDQHLAERLEVAIQGKGAFRRFKDVLYDYPDERQRWFDFKAIRTRERLVYWLEAAGIEAVLHGGTLLRDTLAQPDQALEGPGDSPVDLERLLTDAHGDEEQRWALLEAFTSELAFPLDALVVGEPVTLTAIDYDGNERRGVFARCRRKDRDYVVALADVELPSGAPGARLMAAYRRWLGLDPEA